jgi:arylsulfatase A-like enzyme
VNRRSFLSRVASGIAAASAGDALVANAQTTRHPNLVYVFADQWRAPATGYAGDPNARTPNLDRLAAQSVNFTHAVSGHPVCTPYRGCLMTGQYSLTHGLFVNDVCLNNGAVCFADALAAAGYDTGYIGKWHIDGHGRSAYVPPERRHGFAFWRVEECTHNYNESFYYDEDGTRLKWEGYDAIAQTREAQRYIRDHGKNKPFALFLSWGPPHEPYHTAPEEYRRAVDPERIELRPNVPESRADAARKELAGYYAHIAALDACVGGLLKTLEETGLAENTLFIFTSDHGDMLHSQGSEKKQQPWDESIRVPLLLRYPAKLGSGGRATDALLNTPDIMPTVLGLCGVPVPATVEGRDYSAALLRGESPEADAALITCPAPFSQWGRKKGGREFRGVRTVRHTYVRDLNGPWLLFDNEQDPYQQRNLCNMPEHAEVQAQLEARLARLLEETRDEFLPAEHYLRKWGYETDETGAVPYTR